MIWQQRLPGNDSAAPFAAEGRVYFLNEAGVMTVVSAGREFAVLASNPLDETTLASPAVADGTLYIRTAGNLYRIGSNAK